MTAETGCGRSVLERVSRPGRPGADYEVLLGEVVRLRATLLWIAEYGSRDGDLREGHEDAMRHIAFNALAIDPVEAYPLYQLREDGTIAADDAEVMQALKDCAASIISAVAHGEDALGTIVGGLVETFVLGSLVGRSDG